MTADEILIVFADFHRSAIANLGTAADKAASITFESTIEQWASACDMVDGDLIKWRKLGHGLNEHFRTDITDEEWKEVLAPMKIKTLDGVCKLIASRAMAPCAEPLVILGRPCRTTGVFILIRDILANAGADVSEIKPSTPLGPYMTRWHRVFMTEVTKIAPGTLPPFKINNPLYDLCIWGLLPSVIILMVSIGTQSPYIGIVGLLLFTVSYWGTWVTAPHPTSIELGHLNTFRDLCQAIAAQDEK